MAEETGKDGWMGLESHSQSPPNPIAASNGFVNECSNSSKILKVFILL